ncbi:MAG: hypothetical protein ACI4TZ_03930 [Christensenellales bacterium]
MDFWTAFKYVIAVIAIMAVAGGIIYLLSGVVIKVFEKKNNIKTGEVKPIEKTEETLLLEDSKVDLDEEPELVAKEVDGESVDLDLADEERKAILAQRNDIAEREKVVEQAKDFEEDDKMAEDEDINDIYQRMIAEINAEAFDEEESAEKQAEVKEAEEPEKVEEENEENITDEELNNIIAEINAEAFAEEATEDEQKEENVVADETSQPAEETKEEDIKEQTEVVDEEKENLRKLVEELKEQLLKEKEEKANLEEEKANLEQVKQQKEIEIVDSESLESLNERLEVLTERLAQSEKELKANKKEYLPLLRIKKNLENDKAKLRRKEAVVAKQKVVLFGVNNYVVDPEKEKKLSEDLDVLDALRLSVQHCEEVMKDNEDRYPILEKTNNILKRQVEDLKSDIEDIKQRIATKQANDNGQD